MFENVVVLKCQQFTLSLVLDQFNLLIWPELNYFCRLGQSKSYLQQAGYYLVIISTEHQFKRFKLEL